MRTVQSWTCELGYGADTMFHRTYFLFWKELKKTSTSVFGDGCISTHADPTSTRPENLIDTRLQKLFPPWTLIPGGWPIRPILGFWGAKFLKMRDSLPSTPVNYRAKFDAASFILAGEIRNRTNTHKNKETNSKRYIHAHLAYQHVWMKTD